MFPVDRRTTVAVAGSADAACLSEWGIAGRAAASDVFCIVNNMVSTRRVGEPGRQG